MRISFIPEREIRETPTPRTLVGVDYPRSSTRTAFETLWPFEFLLRNPFSEAAYSTLGTMSAPATPIRSSDEGTPRSVVMTGASRTMTSP